MSKNEQMENQDFVKISERLALLEERLSSLENKVSSGSRQQQFIERIENAGISGGETVAVESWC